MKTCTAQSTWIVLLYILLLGTLVFESYSLQSASIVVSTTGSVSYASVLNDGFVVGGKWWNLETVYAYMSNLSSTFSSFVRREKIGVSYNGYDIYALVIGTGYRYMVIDGAIHGNEKLGTFGALRFANYLIRNWGDPYWNARLHRVTVVMVPVLNPDGFVKDTFAFDPPDGGGCNGNGVNLNRQFPPGVTNTTEPEAIAYLDLWAKYVPTVVVSHHTGSANIVYYSQYMDSWDDLLVKDALQVANQSFVSNGHNENASDGTNLWKINSFGQAGYDSMTVAGAGFLYGAVAVLPEFYRPYETYADVGTDYFLQIDKAMLSNLDNALQTNTVYSSAGLIRIAGNATKVTVTLNNFISTTATISKVYCTDLPSEVWIDGMKTNQGPIWQYDSNTKIVTIRNATKEIMILS